MIDRYGDEVDEPEPASDPYAIAHCEFCDDNGIRGLYVCDHQDYAAIARRGVELCKNALKGNK